MGPVLVPWGGGGGGSDGRMERGASPTLPTGHRALAGPLQAIHCTSVPVL